MSASDEILCNTPVNACPSPIAHSSRLECDSRRNLVGLPWSEGRMRMRSSFAQLGISQVRHEVVPRCAGGCRAAVGYHECLAWVDANVKCQKMVEKCININCCIRVPVHWCTFYICRGYGSSWKVLIAILSKGISTVYIES